MQKILAVIGQEPRRPDEYPTVMRVGWCTKTAHDKTVRIECEEENLGTYGLVWYVAYREDGSVIFKMNAAFVAEVEYGKPE